MRNFQSPMKRKGVQDKFRYTSVTKGEILNDILWKGRFYERLPTLHRCVYVIVFTTTKNNKNGKNMTQILKTHFNECMIP